MPDGYVDIEKSIGNFIVREGKEETDLIISHPRLCGGKKMEFSQDDLKEAKRQIDERYFSGL
ncbi:MAG: hypothetical protein K2O03_15945 [Lachnospiraceae bacterium]|nr:hypothetical protein [Lachnospiraceae bacterium]